MFTGQSLGNGEATDTCADNDAIQTGRGVTFKDVGGGGDSRGRVTSKPPTGPSAAGAGGEDSQTVRRNGTVKTGIANT